MACTMCSYPWPRLAHGQVHAHGLVYTKPTQHPGSWAYRIGTYLTQFISTSHIIKSIADITKSLSVAENCHFLPACVDVLRSTSPRKICDGYVDCPSEDDEKECGKYYICTFPYSAPFAWFGSCGMADCDISAVRGDLSNVLIWCVVIILQT